MHPDIDTYLTKGLKKELLQEAAHRAAHDEVFFEALVAALVEGKKTPAMKASWILQHASAANALFASKRSSLFLELLHREKSGGVQRELIKILGWIAWKEDEEGAYIDACFRVLNSAGADVGTKYNCVHNISQVLKKYPELKEELLASITAQRDVNTDAWQRYISKYIQKLEKKK
jgi:hypothetical protein